jgi:hypothetical protein
MTGDKQEALQVQVFCFVLHRGLTSMKIVLVSTRGSGRCYRVAVYGRAAGD